MIEDWRLLEWREDAEQRANAADAHLVFADRIVRLLDALEAHESEGWASYAAEQERHADTKARLDEMTREARASRRACENAVRASESKFARHEIDRALRAADAPEDSMATDDDLIRYQGRAEAIEIVRIMLGWTDDDVRGLHLCEGCGVELDADDSRARCEDCDA